MPATKDAPIDSAPFMVSYDKLEEHRKDMARRQAEMDAKRPEMLLCCSPQYAAARELEKAQFVFSVDVEWLHLDKKKGPVNFHRKSNHVAQNEADAWAAWCDKNEVWPSLRDVRVQFKKGKQLTQSQVATQQAEGAALDGKIPRVEFQPKNEVKAWTEV